MNFREVITECAMRPEFVSNFNRLMGCNLNFTDRRKPIEVMIDKATGNPNIFHNDSSEMQRFISFVFEVIWMPLVVELNEQIK